MTTPKSATILMAGAMWMVACGMDGTEGEVGSSQAGVSSAEQAGLVRFMNTPETTFQRLDSICGIRSDSAKNLIRHRDGQDKLAGTADDDLFDTAEEIDGVSMVGPWTMARLYTCAERYGFITPSPETCVAQVFEGPEDGDYATNSFSSVAALSPELQAVVATLQQDALQFAYRDRDLTLYPIRFAELVTYVQNSVTVGYTVRFVQMVDSECGVQLHIRYILDSCLRVRDAEASI